MVPIFHKRKSKLKKSKDTVRRFVARLFLFVMSATDIFHEHLQEEQLLHVLVAFEKNSDCYLYDPRRQSNKNNRTCLTHTRVLLSNEVKRNIKRVPKQRVYSERTETYPLKSGFDFGLISSIVE
jgi:hypothetical protein